MDPSTVIVILATHLICSGGLYYLISRDMPPRSGLIYWAAGGLLFGGAYIARLFAEKRTPRAASESICGVFTGAP